MADPISWIVLEPGHAVLTSDGEKLGTVKELLGDSEAVKYVPAELVESIDTEAMHLKISAAETDRLDQYTAPGEPS